METFKDHKGRTRIKVKSGEPLPPMRTIKSIRADELDDAIKAKYEDNMTDGIRLDAIIDNLNPEATVTSHAKLLASAYSTLKDATNAIVGKVDADQTKPLGAKLLLKEKLTKDHFKSYEKRMNALDLQIMETIEGTVKNLFSSNLTLNSVEESVLPAYITKAQDVDLGSLAGSGTPSEAKIALNIMRDFPSLVKTHATYDEATRFANAKHTPVEADELETLAELQDHIRTMARNSSQSKQKFLDPAILETIKNTKVK